MRRRGSVRRDDGITLFPFLAVLICTMGALIVLLVVMVQQARASAVDLSRQRAARRTLQDEQTQKQQEQLRLEQEELQWRIEVLRQSRQQTAEQLEDRRRELSHLEDVIRDLEQELQQLIAEARQLQQLGTPQQTDVLAAEQKIEQLRRQIDQHRESMEAARAQLETEKPSYAIVTYDGPHGTRRRPIFVECLEDRIVLQPEGIELRGDDFHEPITDDNPLASALRAKREYLADVLRNRDGHPYPLLIVRPDGARAYAAARAAMKSWEAEFGYELIDADLPLEYPPVDTAMATSMQRAVEQARARRKYLQSIAPARFGRTESVLRPSSQGGFETVGGSGGSLDDDSWRDDSSGEAARWPGPAQTADGWAAAPSDASPPHGEFQSDTSREALTRQKTLTDQTTATDAATDGTRASVEGPPRIGNAVGTGSTGGRRSTPGHAAAAGQGPQTAIRSEGATKASPQHFSSNSRRDSGMAESADGGPGGPNAAGTSGATAPGPGGAVSSQSLTGTANLSSIRGSDWALPENAVGATSLTRPIRIACYADRFVVLPESRQDGEPVVLTIEGSAREEVDDLVAQVWKRMENWGIAGPGMYWRPVLVAEIRRDGEPRFAELHRLLENSGIVVKRK